MSKTKIVIVEKNKTFFAILYPIYCLATAMIGHTIHGRLGWAIIDFFFAPLAWIKWLIYHEVSISIIKKSFEWFFK